MCRSKGQLSAPAKERLREQTALFHATTDRLKAEHDKGVMDLTSKITRLEREVAAARRAADENARIGNRQRDQLLIYVDTLRAALMQEFAFHGTTGPSGGFPVNQGGQ